ncbi:hypothetical protein I7I51_07731 [Histoplasma capsulatum]|uniref:Uncharacterized protein n=1 Tax=Ajellomyces capsulatus TaxID=5037 RepID=A0A8A1LVV2_AJECA|nr:hypothetical protein I7I51_07731 [Histoplasma capsulatum]
MNQPSASITIIPLLEFNTLASAYHSHGLIISAFRSQTLPMKHLRLTLRESICVNIEYLEKGSPSDAYMAMHEFGPWDSNELKVMKSISVMLVAFVPRAISDREAEEQAAGC